MRVEIDATKCQGHGRCYLLSPDVFDMDDEGMGIVTETMPAAQHVGSVRTAVANCPEQAILVHE